MNKLLWPHHINSCLHITDDKQLIENCMGDLQTYYTIFPIMMNYLHNQNLETDYLYENNSSVDMAESSRYLCVVEYLHEKYDSVY